MGRRKKEPKSTHREKIAAAASTLFMQKGITATSMDDIAKPADAAKRPFMFILRIRRKLSVFWF